MVTASGKGIQAPIARMGPTLPAQRVKLVKLTEFLVQRRVLLRKGRGLLEKHLAGNGKEFGRFYERMARFMFWGGTPAAFFLYAAAPDGLRILLLRGAYTEEALHITVVPESTISLTRF